MSRSDDRERLHAILLTMSLRKLQIERKISQDLPPRCATSVEFVEMRRLCEMALEVLAGALEQWRERCLAEFDRTGYSPYLHVSVLAA